MAVSLEALHACEGLGQKHGVWTGRLEEKAWATRGGLEPQNDAGLVGREHRDLGQQFELLLWRPWEARRLTGEGRQREGH